MEFSHGMSPATPLELLAEWWPIIALYGVMIGIGIVRIVQRPMVPAFSLARRAPERLLSLSARMRGR